ncbi:hypothetical protein FOA52_013529 [Chlamydomonas sp. UWO 241]|nr:hypothetical protein FOA52_013529 [Chlamydomonas sp. UWO 241]
MPMMGTLTTANGHRDDEGLDLVPYLVENRRSYLCFGWHRPLFTAPWRTKEGVSIAKGNGRPATRAYRKVLNATELLEDGKVWEWHIVVDDHTDEAGWQFGGCGFWELLQMRLAMRSRPKRTDLVKQRRWVPAHVVSNPEAAASLKASGSSGQRRYLSPVELQRRKMQQKQAMQAAMAEIWDMVDELDDSIAIRDLYTALLDPVALNRVTKKHVVGMRRQQEDILVWRPALLLSEEEVWPPAADPTAASVPERAQHSAWAPFAQADFSLHPSATFRRIFGQASASGADPPVGLPPPLPSLLASATSAHAAGAPPTPILTASEALASAPSSQLPGSSPPPHGDGGDGGAPPAFPFISLGSLRRLWRGGSRAEGASPPRAPPTHGAANDDTPQPPHVHAPISSAVTSTVGSAVSGANAQPASPPPHLPRAGPSHVHAAISSAASAVSSAVSGADARPASPPPQSSHARPLHVHAAISSAASAVSGADARPASPPPHLPRARPSHVHAAISSAASAVSGADARPASPPPHLPRARPSHVHAAISSAASAVGSVVNSTATAATARTPPLHAPSLFRDSSGGSGEGRYGRAAGATVRAAGDILTGGLAGWRLAAAETRHQLARLGNLGRTSKQPHAMATPRKMVLSVTELEVASMHAMAIYGDLEKYVDGIPAQTRGEAVRKFTGVPPTDILYSTWRSRVWKPANYVAIDRGAGKIIVCIRGTMDNEDIITDLAGRPVRYQFAPGVEGEVHSGMLKAAKWLFNKLWRSGALQAAVAAAPPEYSLLVCGHSLGGGVASVIAAMLKFDPRLSEQARAGVRAVVLAPAAVFDLELAQYVRDFVASVILGRDMVPRVDVYSFAGFVQDVAAESPLKQLLLRAWRLGGPSKSAAEKKKTKAVVKGHKAGAIDLSNSDSECSDEEDGGVNGLTAAGRAARQSLTGAAGKTSDLSESALTACVRSIADEEVAAARAATGKEAAAAGKGPAAGEEAEAHAAAQTVETAAPSASVGLPAVAVGEEEEAARGEGAVAGEEAEAHAAAQTVETAAPSASVGATDVAVGEEEEAARGEGRAGAAATASGGAATVETAAPSAPVGQPDVAAMLAVAGEDAETARGEAVAGQEADAAALAVETPAHRSSASPGSALAARVRSAAEDAGADRDVGGAGSLLCVVHGVLHEVLQDGAEEEEEGEAVAGPRSQAQPEARVASSRAATGTAAAAATASASAKAAPKPQAVSEIDEAEAEMEAASQPGGDGGGATPDMQATGAGSAPVAQETPHAAGEAAPPAPVPAAPATSLNSGAVDPAPASSGAAQPLGAAPDEKKKKTEAAGAPSPSGMPRIGKLEGLDKDKKPFSRMYPPGVLLWVIPQREKDRKLATLAGVGRMQSRAHAALTGLVAPKMGGASCEDVDRADQADLQAELLAKAAVLSCWVSCGASPADDFEEADGTSVASPSGRGDGTKDVASPSGRSDGGAVGAVGGGAGAVGAAGESSGRDDSVGCGAGCSGKRRKGKKKGKPEPMLLLRKVPPETFEPMFFFKGALMDHLPNNYLTGMRALVRQQRAAIQAAREDEQQGGDGWAFRRHKFGRHNATAGQVHDPAV